MHLIPSSSIEKIKLVTNLLHRTLLTDPQTDLPLKKELIPRETSSHLGLQTDQIMKTNKKVTLETSEIVRIQDEHLKFGKDGEDEGVRCKNISRGKSIRSLNVASNIVNSSILV